MSEWLCAVFLATTLGAYVWIAVGLGTVASALATKRAAPRRIAMSLRFVMPAIVIVGPLIALLGVGHVADAEASSSATQLAKRISAVMNAVTLGSVAAITLALAVLVFAVGRRLERRLSGR